MRAKGEHYLLTSRSFSIKLAVWRFIAQMNVTHKGCEFKMTLSVIKFINPDLGNLGNSHHHWNKLDRNRAAFSFLEEQSTQHVSVRFRRIDRAGFDRHSVPLHHIRTPLSFANLHIAAIIHHTKVLSQHT